MNNPSTTYYESQIINKITCNNLSDTKKNVNTIPVAYYEPFDSMAIFEIKPTGRWKLVHNKFIRRQVLYIEHRYFWIFTTWLHEEDVNFYNTYSRNEVIVDCKKL